MLRQSRERLVRLMLVVVVTYPVLVWPWADHEPLWHTLSHFVATSLLCAYLLWHEWSERRQAKEYMRVVDALADWAVVHGTDGRIVYVSDAIRQFGVDPKALIGRHWTEVTPPVDLRHMQSWLDMVRPGAPEKIGPTTAEMVIPGGAKRLMEMCMYRIQIGNQTRFLIVFRDVTESRLMDEAMTRMDRLATVAHLADGVAHNFNNIFGGIMLNTELLLHGEGKERDVFAERIVSGAERGADLCRKLLTVARGEAPSLRRVELCPLVSDLVSLLETKANARRIEMRCEIDRSLAATADPGQLRQVMLNLLINAKEAAGENGWVRVVGERRGKTVVLAVSNSGPAIPPAHLNLIFLPFFSTKKESVQGTGLGLAVAQRLTEGMGGRLNVTSCPDQPTTFTVTLSAADPAREDGASRCVS